LVFTLLKVTIGTLSYIIIVIEETTTEPGKEKVFVVVGWKQKEKERKRKEKKNHNNYERVRAGDGSSRD